MRKPEQRLWDRMRKALGQKYYLERIENGVSAGRPDVDLMWRGIVLPFELKVGTYPKRPSTPILGKSGLNQNQLNWWLTWRKHGGQGFILVGVEQDIFLVPGKYSEQVNDFTHADMAEFYCQWNEFSTQIYKQIDFICSQHR